MVRDLLDAGIHFGHRCARWNPKMKPFIHSKRSGIHIIDIRETLRGLLQAKKFISRVVSSGGDVLFVGTKRQARTVVQEQALRCKMHYVSERWLGGTLTNFRTIRSRLQRLDELEALVDSPEWETGYSKKMKSMLARELKKIRRNLDGIRRMNRLPGVVVLIDVHREANAIHESQALKIPTIGLLDTDSDPDHVTIAIPGNDDAIRSINVIIHNLADAVEEGLRARPEPQETTEGRKGREFGTPQRRRGRRPASTPHSESPVGASPTPAESGSSEPAVAVAGAIEEPSTAPPTPAPAEQPLVGQPKQMDIPTSTDTGGENPANQG
ncbi:MAG: 30S ribosomal protein S2 [Planctomycetota bacterium]